MVRFRRFAAVEMNRYRDAGILPVLSGQTIDSADSDSL